MKITDAQRPTPLYARIGVAAFLRHYVDVPTFLRLCENCPNFGQVWSCPPYDFDPLTIWQQHRVLHLHGVKVHVPEELVQQTWSPEQLDRHIEALLSPVKAALTTRLEALNAQHPGSRCLAAGRCELCVPCGRARGEGCKYPDRMHYSIESLGGNVGKVTGDLLHTPLLWGQQGRLPAYFVLVGGLLV